MRRLFFKFLTSACVGAASSVVFAQPLAPPQDVLTLAASAAVEVPYDVISMTLTATREGSDASTVQAQLRQAIDAALGEARRAQRPGQLDVRTGAFSLTPRYGSRGAPSPAGSAPARSCSRGATPPPSRSWPRACPQ